MKDTYSIRDLINLLVSKLFTIILITAIFGAGAFGVAKFILPLKYSSSLTMYVQSYTSLVVDDQTSSSINNAKQVINTYKLVLKDDAVMAAAGKELVKLFDPAVLGESLTLSKGEISASSLRGTLSITSEADTSAIKVTATTRNPELSAAICDALAKVAPKYINDAVHNGTLNTIGKAPVRQNPVSPNVPRITVLGAAIGAVFIVALILIVDLFDNTVKTTSELTKKYNKAILGEIQNIDGGKSKKKKKKKSSKKESSVTRKRNLLTDAEIPFSVTESYKSIRTNITFALSTHKKKVIVVSSSNPSEGKSTTAANIAIAFSQMDNKVLLIDADMRKSVQHRVFKISNRSGLSTLIGKMSSLPESIKRNVMTNLDVLPAGPCPPNPSELLASEQFKDMLNALAVNYDYVIVDTPPINVVSDGLVFSDTIGGILFVLKYASTTYDDIDVAMKKVELAEANMIGFILNDVKLEHRAGYYGRYGKYGKYGKYGYSQYGYGKTGSAAAAAAADGGAAEADAAAES